VKLKRLIVQGFKSFKDRTVIHFDDGITGIVGPNGCGKSNIVDALFWIMGEQSAKHLRGQSMKDVIFAGSSKYAPANWAEASLVIENVEGKHIHIGNTVSSPQEIALTRKLYRNGESEYRINDNICRLKDVQEVFMDTGAGAKSYSIIAQGEINRIVQSKPEDRRVMIEEVAGITKFKLRRRESLRKIEQTQSNLSRLQDLKLEIEKQLKVLEKQAEKAERARHMKERVIKYELITESHKEFDLLKDIRDHHTFLNEKTINVQNWKIRKDGLEISLEQERLEREIQTQKLDELQGQYNQISRQLAAQEERLNNLCRAQSEKEKLLDEKRRESEELAQELAQRQVRLSELSTALNEAVERGQEQTDFSELEERLNFLKQEKDSREDELKEAQRNHETVRLECQSIRQEKANVGPKLAEYAATLQDMALEIEALEKQFSGVSGELASKREELKKLEVAVQLAEEELKNWQTELSKNKIDLATLESELQSKTKLSMQVESKLSSLEELNSSFEGLKEGTALALKEQEASGVKLFGRLIKCPTEMSAAVQCALADILECLIFDGSLQDSLGESILAKGVDCLVPGRADIQTTLETCARLKTKGFTEVIALADLVEISEGNEALKVFLEGHYLAQCDDQKVWQQVPTEINFRSITSLDGKVQIKNLGAGKLVSYATQGDESFGLVARNNKIDELKGQRLQLLAEKTEAEQKAVSERAKLIELEKKVEETRNFLRDGREKFVALKSYIETKSEVHSSGNSRLQILINRKQEVSKSRLELIIREEELSKKEEILDKDQEEKLSRVEDQKDALEMLKSRYEDDRGEFLRLSAEAKTYNERVKSLESQIKDITAQLERLDQRGINNQSSILRYEEEVTGLEQELATLEKSNLDTSQVLVEREEMLSLMRDRLSELLTGMQERENEVKDLGHKINKSEKDMVEHEVKIGQSLTEEEQVTRNVFEKYRIDLRQTISAALEYTSEELTQLHDLAAMFTMEGPEGPEKVEAVTYEFTRRYGQDLKECHVKLREARTELNRLGEINWQAIEDYDRQKLRFDFLVKQEDELKASLEDLKLAIEKIDIKSRERFKVAFEEVSSRFEKVFPIIFDGGVAKLALVGSPDDPEAGVDIIAQPPGKKMQNINLMSGGEKALTAIALIFSIFLVKPSPFCLLDEVDAPLDDANVGRFVELLREMSKDSQFILITHNKKTMELNDTLYGVTMQEQGVSKAVSVQLH